MAGGGGGGGITINLILGYKGEPPKKICKKKGGLQNMYYRSYLLTFNSHAFPIRNERSLIKTLYRSCE